MQSSILHLLSSILYPPSSRRASRAFTLVELIVVIAIIALLAGLGLGAMQHIGRTTALATAARQVSSHMTMARQYAIVNNTYVLMVIPTKNTTNLYSTSASTDTLDYAYKSYGFALPYPTNIPGSFIQYTNFVYIDEVQFLPNGVVFSNFVFNGANFIERSVPFPSDWPSATNLTAAAIITFAPTGQAPPLSIRPGLTLFEGVVNPPTTNPVRTAASATWYELEVNPLIIKTVVTKRP